MALIEYYKDIFISLINSWSLGLIIIVLLLKPSLLSLLTVLVGLCNRVDTISKDGIDFQKRRSTQHNNDAGGFSGNTNPPSETNSTTNSKDDIKLNELQPDQSNINESFGTKEYPSETNLTANNSEHTSDTIIGNREKIILLFLPCLHLTTYPLNYIIFLMKHKIILSKQ